MSEADTQSHFSGPYKEWLEELAELIDWLKINHELSFVKAGDNAIYAYGGNGYVLVFDESIWGGLIELLAPDCTFTIKPKEDGKVVVTPSHADEKTSKASFKAAIAAIREYYETRYWRTPIPSPPRQDKS